MPSRYHPDHKAAVLVVLERNGGNMKATSRQTGIPVRTLRHWRGDILPYLPPPPTPRRQQIAEVPAFQDDIEALSFIRQNIIAELSRLSASLQYDSGFSTPYQRALVLSQLMDKLLKLDLHLKPYAKAEDEGNEIILVYKGDNSYHWETESEIGTSQSDAVGLLDDTAELG
jgi:hypothetical protein